MAIADVASAVRSKGLVAGVQKRAHTPMITQNPQYINSMYCMRAATGMAMSSMIDNWYVMDCILWAWFFLTVNLAKVPIFLSLGMITPGTLGFSLVLFPMVVAGALVGRRLFRIIPQGLFNALVLILAAAAALRMVGVLRWP